MVVDWKDVLTRAAAGEEDATMQMLERCGKILYTTWQKRYASVLFGGDALQEARLAIIIKVRSPDFDVDKISSYSPVSWLCNQGIWAMGRMVQNNKLLLRNDVARLSADFEDENLHADIRIREMKTNEAECTSPGCPMPVVTNGYCARHSRAYHRAKKTFGVGRCSCGGVVRSKDGVAHCEFKHRGPICERPGCNKHTTKGLKNWKTRYKRFCSRKCERNRNAKRLRTYSNGYQAKRRVSIEGRECRSCFVNDSETTWGSTHQTLCGTCKRQRERRGSCSCGVILRPTGKAPSLCGVCDVEALLARGCVRVELVHPDGRRRVIWRTNLVAQTLELEPMMTATKKQWRKWR